MSEKDKRVYAKLKADHAKYAAYVERKRREAKRRQELRGYETSRKRNWRLANPERAQDIRQAGHAVDTALNNGSLTRPDACQGCGKGTKPEAHHHKGYGRENWLDVVWLCQPCHRKADLLLLKVQSTAS